MAGYQQDAQANITGVVSGMNEINNDPHMTAVQAQGAYTARLVHITIANTQALLAINETLTDILTHLKERP